MSRVSNPRLVVSSRSPRNSEVQSVVATLGAELHSGLSDVALLRIFAYNLEADFAVWSPAIVRLKLSLLSICDNHILVLHRLRCHNLPRDQPYHNSLTGHAAHCLSRNRCNLLSNE